ncbi:hypothetical protein BDQ17DRAFT_1335616 [Cyathus striatus]|nr:hypothetical protein BDQ17DRAFT_1335616 [Cyathus striatus]
MPQVSQVAFPMPAKYLQQMSFAMAYAYSREFNNRALESHFYGVWGLIFNAIANSQAPDFFVIPQHTIYTARGRPVELSASTASRAETKAKSYIPDFAIICALSAKSPTHVVPWTPIIYHWDTVSIQKATPFMLAEIKHIPSRSIEKSGQFMEVLKKEMSRATRQLMQYARAVFISDGRKTSKVLVLVAIVGEWWRWSIVHRDKLLTATEQKSNFKHGLDKLEQEAQSQNNDDYEYDVEEEQLQETAYVYRHVEVLDAIGEPEISPAVPPADNKWSKYMVLGTVASTEHFVLINSRLMNFTTLMSN